MASPLVTVVMVQRDRFSVAPRAIRHLYDETHVPFRFLYIDGGSPRSVRKALDELQQSLRFPLLRTPHFLTPNQARAIGLREVTTPYVVFIDNDCLVQPGWLNALIDAAEETGAWVVGPLYAEGDPTPERVHVAGGFITIEGEPGQRRFHDTLRLADLAWSSLPESLTREQCDFVEFHCMLARADALRGVGGLDQQLLSSREHLDVCLRVTDAGGEVWFEPRAVVNFGFPPELRPTDLPYFLWRWSERAIHLTVEHFRAKYGLDADYLVIGRSIGRDLRHDALFEPLRSFARRSFGPQGERVLLAALRKTVGRIEPKLNSLVVRPPRAQTGVVARTS
jgi:glycosyltransferase involved in cell wall biosynthesis